MRFTKSQASSKLLFTFILLLFHQVSQAQINELLGKLGSKPSEAQIQSGIKEALEKATDLTVERLSLENGFLQNPDIKILFPPEARKVESTLRKIGLGNVADDVITSLNRAAEDAAKEAKPIFTDAIKSMTLKDVQQILLGEQNAATNYFQKTTSDSLAVKFSPKIDQSLSKTDATKIWESAMENYNKLPFVKPVETDLTKYVTDKAIEGLFVEIAKEEVEIREKIGARTSPLLQSVFGYAEQEKIKDPKK
jgi:hypothetical protein